MKVRIKDICLDLRVSGLIAKVLIPTYTKEKFIRQNRRDDKKIKGKWKSKDTTIEEVYILRKDNTKLRVLICRAHNHSNSNVTGLLWLHSGGYAMGLPELCTSYGDLFCKDDQCIMIIPNYRKAIEHPYPAALEDSYLTLEWIKSNANELNINEDQLFIGGNSAGGGLCAATCLLARDNNIAIAFQMPLYPMLDDRMNTASYVDNNAPVWNLKSSEAAWKLYLGEIETITQYAAPARTKDFTNLPPTLTIIGTLDPFYDETKTYISKLKEGGIKTHYREYKGCFHAFDLFYQLSKTALAARLYLFEEFKYAQSKYFAKQNK